MYVLVFSCNSTIGWIYIIDINKFINALISPISGMVSLKRDILYWVSNIYAYFLSVYLCIHNITITCILWYIGIFDHYCVLPILILLRVLSNKIVRCLSLLYHSHYLQPLAPYLPVVPRNINSNSFYP